MAFRRRRFARRRRYTPRRKYFKRRYVRRFGKRKSRSGDMVLKCVRVENIEHTTNQNQFLPLHVDPQSFGEFRVLNPYFEAYRIMKYTITVIPTANISNNSTSESMMYALVPWKKEIADSAVSYTFNDWLSVDRAKAYRGTTKARRSFVPGVRFAGRQNDPTKLNSFGPVTWRPRIEIDEETTRIKHYTGIIAFHKKDDANATGKHVYQLIHQVTMKLYNQNSLQPVNPQPKSRIERDTEPEMEMSDASDFEELVPDRKKRESLLERLKKHKPLLLN